MRSMNIRCMFSFRTWIEEKTTLRMFERSFNRDEWTRCCCLYFESALRRTSDNDILAVERISASKRRSKKKFTWLTATINRSISTILSHSMLWSRSESKSRLERSLRTSWESRCWCYKVEIRNSSLNVVFSLLHDSYFFNISRICSIRRRKWYRSTKSESISTWKMR